MNIFKLDNSTHNMGDKRVKTDKDIQQIVRSLFFVATLFGFMALTH